MEHGILNPVMRKKRYPATDNKLHERKLITEKELRNKQLRNKANLSFILSVVVMMAICVILFKKLTTRMEQTNGYAVERQK